MPLLSNTSGCRRNNLPVLISLHTVHCSCAISPLEATSFPSYINGRTVKTVTSTYIKSCGKAKIAFYHGYFEMHLPSHDWYTDDKKKPGSHIIIWIRLPTSNLLKRSLLPSVISICYSMCHLDNTKEMPHFCGVAHSACLVSKIQRWIFWHFYSGMLVCQLFIRC